MRVSEKDDGACENEAEGQCQQRLDAKHEVTRAQPIGGEGEEPHGVFLSFRGMDDRAGLRRMGLSNRVVGATGHFTRSLSPG